MKQQRLYYIDNIRIFLCILTIIFHNARSYVDYWWHPIATPLTSPLLLPYVSIFLAFGMCFFFLITGYFTPITFERTDIKTFNKIRLKRFLVPLLIFMCIMPFVMYSQFSSDGYVENITFFDYFINYFIGLGEKPDGWTNPIWPDFNYGHLWFLGHLLFYGMVYSLYRQFKIKNESNKDGLKVKEEGIEIKKDRSDLNSEKKTSPFPSLIKILSFILIHSIFTFIVRIWFRMSEWVTILFVFQVAPAHLIQYTIFFILGLKANKSQWKDKITDRMGKISLLIMTICIVLISIVNEYVPLYYPIYQVGFSIHQYLYCLWEIIITISSIIGILYLFKKHFSHQNDFMKKMTKQTYMVFILHVPVLLGIQSIFLPLLWDPILLSFIVLVIAVPLLFSVSILLRKIPYIKKYL